MEHYAWVNIIEVIVIMMYYVFISDCAPGIYESALCHVCPENSESLESGLSAYTCDEDYYRAAGEEDLPCTREYK